MKITVIIDRTKWSRGQLPQNALLIDQEIRNEGKMFNSNNLPLPKVGQMCCLGFACLASGAKKEDIKGKHMPNGTNLDLPGLTRKSEPFGFLEDTDFAGEAASINDDKNLTDKQREKKLKSLAWKNGFIFKFIN